MRENGESMKGRLVHGMPSKMTSNEIKTKVIVQNLEEVVDLKVTYI